MLTGCSLFPHVNPLLILSCHRCQVRTWGRTAPRPAPSSQYCRATAPRRAAAWTRCGWTPHRWGVRSPRGAVQNKIVCVWLQVLLSLRPC